MLHIILIIFMIIIIIILLNQIININESFDVFSPYAGNQSYPFVYEKTLDQKMLQKKLKIYETPFNCISNAGYYNAEPKGIPPLVSICSFESYQNPPF